MKKRKQPVEEREGTDASGNVIFYDAEGKPFVVEDSKNKEEEK